MFFTSMAIIRTRRCRTISTPGCRNSPVAESCCFTIPTSAGTTSAFGDFSRSCLGTTPCFEFLHGFGLGVAAVGPEAPEVVKRLCHPDDDGVVAAVRERLSQLGGVWISANEAMLDGKRQRERVHRVERELNERAEAVGRLEGEYQDLQRRLESGAALLTQKDDLLGDQQRLIAEQEEGIARTKAMLDERDRQLAEKNAEMADRDKELAEKNAVLADRDRKLAEKSAELADRDRKLAEKSAELADRDRKLAEKSAELADRDRELAEKQAELAQKEAALAEHANRQGLMRSGGDQALASVEMEVAARTSRLTEDRDLLARYLSRTFHRPWRPFKFYVNYNLLRSLSMLTAPFSEKMALRFMRSAEKRSPSRFDVYLPCAVDPPSPISVPPTPEIRRCPSRSSQRPAVPEPPGWRRRLRMSGHSYCRSARTGQL